MELMLFMVALFLMSTVGFILYSRKNGDSAVLMLTSLSSGLFIVFSIVVDFVKFVV